MDSFDDLPGRDIREKMINFIRKHYSGTLGEDVALLDRPDGLDTLQKKVNAKYAKLLK